MGWLLAALEAPKRLRGRRWFFYVHIVSGVLFGLYFVVIGLTGSAVVFVPEFRLATMPQASAQPHRTEPLPLRTVLQRVSLAYPDRYATGVRSYFPDPDAPYRITLKRKSGGDGMGIFAYVDRFTGDVVGTEPYWITWLVDLHVYLLGGTRGHVVNGFGAILLAIACLTGIVVWWPGLRSWTSGLKVNWRASWQRVIYDAHQMIGALALVPLLGLALTGTYYAFPAHVSRAIHWAANEAPPRPAPRSVPPAVVPPIELEALLARANEALPGGVVTAFSLPTAPTSALQVRIKLPDDDWEAGRSLVYLDLYSGDVREVYNVLALSPAQRIISWITPFHFGRFGGLATELLWIVVGITPAFLFVSGCLMWWNRFLSRHWRERRASVSIDSLPRAVNE